MVRLKRLAGYALSRVEAYLIVGLVFIAVVVAILGQWPDWVILASVGAGILMMGLLVVDSLSDPAVERGAAIVEVEVGRVRDRALRARVARAVEYVRAAHKLAGDAGGALDAADDELPQMEAAARSIFQMSLRLQEFRGDRLIERDLADLRQQQKSRRGGLTTDQSAHLDALQRLHDLVQAAEKEIDAALAHLGRSYAEMQAIKVTPELHGRAADVFNELESSTRRLSELAQGYDEVFRGQTKPGSRAHGG